jgi:cellulose synthase/poly-beta-1,6-N-acetylglucosamine synthase-like glycosyltransferase
VTIVISAFDEEASIGATLENKTSLDYPRDRLEVIVVSDASTDGTERIVRSFEGRGVRLLVQEKRQGKTAALNRAVAEAKGEVVAFSDANSIWGRDALRRLVRNFADPSVGYVTGKMVYVDETGTVVGSGCSAYMRYENRLRTLETRVGSVVGVDGGVDAVRRSLYDPMRPDLLPDFVLPLSVVRKGFRVVYEPDALLHERSLESVDDEYRMRVRVTLRAYRALLATADLLNPVRRPLFAFQLATHKVLRYSVGLFQALALASNVLLIGRGAVYQWAFWGQLVFYMAASLGFSVPRLSRVRLLRYPQYLCLVNAAAVAAFVRFLRGETSATWQPRKG